MLSLLDIISEAISKTGDVRLERIVKRRGVNENFRKFAAFMAKVAGSHLTMMLAVLLLLLSGFYYRFSEKWEQHTTFIVAIVTFLMIFVLQNSQNFGEKVTHLKLDELIHAIPEAQSEVASAEEKEEHEIDALKTAAVEKLKSATSAQS